MQILIENPSIIELLGYLQSTPLVSKVDIKNYVNKVHLNATFFVARENGRIIGINIVYFNDLVTKQGYITYIHVDEKYRKQGIGRELLQKSIEYGLQHEFESIRLEVRKNNAVAMRLYSQEGFVIVAEKELSYYMQKNIRP